MARIVNYMGVMIGMQVLMVMAGIPTASHSLLNAIVPGGFSTIDGFIGLMTSSAAGLLISALGIALTTWGLLGAAQIIPGFFVRQNANSPILAVFAGLLSTLGVADMVGAVTYMSSICPVASDCRFAVYIVTFIFTVFIAVYVVSLFQWINGNDI